MDRTNQDWVAACRRLSPHLTIEMSEWAGSAADQPWPSRSLDEPSPGASSARFDPASPWPDAAREAAEHWLPERLLREAGGNHIERISDVATVLDVFAIWQTSTPPIAIATLPPPERAVPEHVGAFHSNPDTT